ncbi:MAG TPA: sulfotransferase [Gammaproteobacteria bacterium]|nr:sulfotransferase [Gammaproteobacteria bacterium]
MKWIWREGRLAWPPLCVAIFTTGLILAFDYCWRIIKAPFWQFALAGAAAWTIGVAVIMAVAVAVGRRGARRSYELKKKSDFSAFRKNANWYKLKFLRRWCDFDPEENLVISAYERGGSTWLAELLRLIPKTAVFTEPLYLGELNPFRALNFSWNQYIPEDAEWPEAAEMFEAMMRGKLLSTWTSSTYSFVTADRMILKFCFANALLPWLTRQFNFKYTPICLVRHPFAIAASKLNLLGWDQPFDGYRIPDGPFKERYLEHEAFFSGIRTQAEALVANWCMAALVPLRNNRNNQDWITVYYENLLTDPENELRRIFDRWQLPVPDKLYTRAGRPSSTTQNPTFTDDKHKQLAKWQSLFDKDQIARMMSVLEYFNVEEYGSDVYPHPQRATKEKVKA